MADNNGGPWGGGGSGGNNGNDNKPGGNRGGGNNGGSQIPEIDDLMKKGQEQLRVLMGGKGAGNGGGGGAATNPGLPRGTFVLAGLIAVGVYLFSSFYTVKPEEKSVELIFGEYSSTKGPGARMAFWPFETANVLPVTREQTVDIGVGRSGTDAGLMLTRDENVVDIDFQVVWNITDPGRYLFNLADPELAIAAVSESAMREIVAQSNLAPILNRDRGVIADRLQELVQTTLDSYDSGVQVIRVNFNRADPPDQVIDAFRDVQAAEQERDRSQNKADEYANKVLAEARGESAQMLEQAEGYRAQVVNGASGEASRFSAVLAEYLKAPEVTRKRLYLETMEQVLGRVDKIILDENAGGGQGVVSYLPLNELRRNTNTGGN